MFRSYAFDQQTPAKPSEDISARCNAVVAEHEKMMTEMKTTDPRLDDPVWDMNVAPGQAKLDVVGGMQHWSQMYRCCAERV